jgi:uncharacterized protein
MSLKQKIIDDLKVAMKAGDTVKRDTLRMLDSMVKNFEIEKKKRDTGLSDEETREVIARAIKQRKDAAGQYEAAGRPELAEKEKNEVSILSEYMPRQLSEDEARQEVKRILSELGISAKDQMGRAMGATMEKLKGRADGQVVKKIVEEELN